MKIGFTGSHSTGKTTLVNVLMSSHYFNDYKLDTNVTRWIKEIGFNINKDGESIGQELIMIRRVAYLFAYDNILSDRSVIDVLAYTESGYDLGKIDANAYNRIKSLFQRSYNEYNHIFYLSPEFGIVDDGVRLTDISYQNEIDDRIKSIIKRFDIKVTHINGDVVSRMNKVLKICGGLNEFK